MGRFDWLEFGQKKETIPLGKPQETFDARHYLQEAERAYRHGAYELALRRYAMALREDHLLEEAWCGQVNCLAELGELPEARTWANKALESLPESPLLLSAKALVLTKMGEYADAAALSDRAIAKKEPAPQVWLMRGLALINREPPGNAAYCFTKAAEISGNDGFIAARIGLAYVEKDQFPRAKQYLDQAMLKDPENPLVWYAMGKCFEGLYAATRAAECYERALSLKPEFKEQVLQNLGRLAGRGCWDTLADAVKRWWEHGT